MNRSLIDIVCCPDCGGILELREPLEEGNAIVSAQLVCTAESKKFPVIDGIPRFVPSENYSSSFGFQWNQYRKTQLDSHTGISTSRKRLLRFTGLPPDDFLGKSVLDIGCGAGRFAEVALSLGARVVALDYSTAVDACRQNLGPHPLLDVVQGDIYRLPFRPGNFDLVYCLGVLQHTPDVRKAFMSLPRQVRLGGRLTVDVYPKLILNYFWPKYWLRPITKRMSHDRLFHLVCWMVKYLLPVSLRLGRIPLVGRKLRYVIPVANHELDWPLTPEQVREWALLNTYDMLAPLHDHPQSAETLKRWFEEARMGNVEVFRAGFYVGRAVKTRDSK